MSTNLDLLTILQLEELLVALLDVKVVLNLRGSLCLALGFLDRRLGGPGEWTAADRSNKQTRWQPGKKRQAPGSIRVETGGTGIEPGIGKAEAGIFLGGQALAP